MLTLYHHGSSVCAAKVRLALYEKSLPWEGVYVDILKGEQFTPEYLKLNPKAVVPTLVHDGAAIRDSNIICEYLDDVFPAHSLRPSDPAIAAEARIWAKGVDEELHPACAALTFMASHRHTIQRLGPEALRKFLDSTPEFSVTTDWHEKKKMFVRDGFGAPGGADKVRLYDAYLAKMEDALAAHDWLAGGAFSFADVAMTPYVTRLDMLSMDGLWRGGRRPRVADWFERIKARTSYRPALYEWIPEQLENDLRTNGAKSWPEVAAIVGI
jgi:glutathione S-transferase